MLQEFLKIYSRDLDKLKTEISAFNSPDNLWKTFGHITNPAGNLCLHLIGNLKTYIGLNMGNVAYIRNRDAEFSSKYVDKDELIKGIEETKQIVVSVLSRLDEATLAETHKEDVLGYSMTNAYFLIHLSAHLSYHLGQINYIRRGLE